MISAEKRAGSAPTRKREPESQSYILISRLPGVMPRPWSSSRPMTCVSCDCSGGQSLAQQDAKKPGKAQQLLKQRWPLESLSLFFADRHTPVTLR